MTSPQVDTDSARSVINANTLMIAFIAVVLSHLVPSVFARVQRRWTTVGVLSPKLEWFARRPMTLNGQDTYRKDLFLSEASLELMSGFDRMYLR